VVCAISDLPSVSFKANAVTLSKDAQVVLNGVADKMKNNPNCKVVVTGYGLPSKSSQQLSWDRVNAVIKYLHEKQSIGLERFIFRYGQNEGEPNTVDLKGTISSDEGMNNVPAPHPNLRKK
jgi:hypothetical protein